MISPLAVATQGLLTTPLLISVQGLLAISGGGPVLGLGIIHYRPVLRVRRR